MPRPPPRKIGQYSEEFKATAVRLSELEGVAVQDVAEALAIHPFMPSRWRKEVREGRIVAKGVKLDEKVAAELKELRQVKRDHDRLKVEHDLLKEPIEFTSRKRRISSSASRSSEDDAQ